MIDLTTITIKEWIITGILVVAFILIIIWMFRRKRRRDSIAKEIVDVRMGLRDTDKFLGELQNYFDRVERKLSMNHIRANENENN